MVALSATRALRTCGTACTLCTLQASGEESADRAGEEVLRALTFGPEETRRPDLISYVVDVNGTRPLKGGNWF